VVESIFLLSSVNGKNLQHSLTYKLSQASRNGGIRNARFCSSASDGRYEFSCAAGRPNLWFMCFSCASEGWEAGDDALHLFLGPTPSIKYHISDILDHCHSSICFPTMVQGSYQSTVCGGFGSGKWKHEIPFTRLL
ncbi:unnamed protein product, partial [Musa textilis]